MDEILNVITEPAIIAIFTILSGLGGVAALLTFRSRKKSEESSSGPKVRKEALKKPDHVKTVATTVVVAPPIHEVGHAVSEAIVPMAETVSLEPSIVSQAAELAGGVAQVSSSASLADDGSAIEAVVEVTKGIVR
jgi:hypothetical protein